MILIFIILRQNAIHCLNDIVFLIIGNDDYVCKQSEAFLKLGRAN